MRRYLEEPIKRDLREKIVLLSGPRQVGKTFLSRQLYHDHEYLNHDSPPDREMMRRREWRRRVPLVIFDELHKMKNWKSWIKGIYDTEGVRPGLLVTGSARLAALRKAGDSLAGRFFSYRLHPLTVKEVVMALGEKPQPTLERLLKFGGFPEPFLKENEMATRRWRKSHIDTILRQDLLDLERIRDIKSVELLIDLLRRRVGSPVSYTSLAVDLQVSVPTIKHWLEILENLYVVFPVRPFHRNIARSIVKEPKYYLYDTGSLPADDPGARFENTVALALLCELHRLEDVTGADVSLCYLRDKNKNEVDFLALVDHKPVLLAEAKVTGDTFSRSLFSFRKYFPGVRIVQVVERLPRPRETREAEMLPAAQFLAQLSLAT